MQDNRYKLTQLKFYLPFLISLPKYQKLMKYGLKISILNILWNEQ